MHRCRGTGSTLGVIFQALSALFIQLELSLAWDSQRRPTGSPRDPPVYPQCRDYQEAPPQQGFQCGSGSLAGILLLAKPALH